MISVVHLTRTFGALRALDDVSFEVAKGEVVGILGPNGAGKTTLLRILAGYLPASRGAARVAGFDVLRESLDVRRRIGYLPESVPLYREHRVVEMLEFQARLHEIPRADRKRRVAAALESVGLSDRARDLIGNLSRGLRQRAGIAVALLPEPEVLILDEPTSGLDPLQRIDVRALIRALAEKHTVLLSSHILPEIEAVCPRVVILHEGRIAADGTPDALVKTLAHVAHVRLEAFVGPNVEPAQKLLRSLRGVTDVRDLGRLGIHHQFEIVCEEDLREDVGALAAARGWALRELSWRRPTLEQIFARIALGHVHDAPRPATHSVSSPNVDVDASNAANLLTLGGVPAVPGVPDTRTASTLPAPAPKKAVYNLNPFELGATRDLAQPKPSDGSGSSRAPDTKPQEKPGSCADERGPKST